MGFAESLRKVNYLAPAWEVIARARQQNKQEQARENFLKALDQAYGKVQEIDNAPVATIDAEGYSQNPNNWTPAPQTISSSQNLFNKNAGQLTAPPPSPNMNMSDDPAKTMNIPVPPKIPMDNQLNELGMLPDAEIGPSKDNTKVRQLQTNEIVNFMKGQLGNKDLDPNLLNQGSGLLSMLLRKPSSTKLEQIDTTKDLYSIDENGKMTLVKPGKDKVSDMKNLWVKVGEANKNGRSVATLRNYLTGETQEVDLGEPKQTGSNVEVNLPEVNINNDLAKLTEYQDTYDYWDKIANDTTKTPEERAQAVDQKNAVFGKIKGVNASLVSSLNDKVPGFEGTFNLLMQKIGSDPSKIDNVVETDLKGKSPDVIRWMKRALHASVFTGEKWKEPK